MIMGWTSGRTDNSGVEVGFCESVCFLSPSGQNLLNAALRPKHSLSKIKYFTISVLEIYCVSLKPLQITKLDRTYTKSL